MSKKRIRNKKKASSTTRRRRPLVFVLTGVIAVLCFASVIAAWSGPLGRGTGLSWFGPVPTPTPLSLAKEYIYVAERLVATEEPGVLVPPPPANMLADTFSATRIDLSWTASQGADHYEVERASSLSAGFTVLNANVTTTTYSDSSVSSGNAYIYRVRAANSSGGLSPYGNIDVATAITFTDDPLITGSTIIKAAHITELRQAVNALRTAANLSAASWTDGTLTGLTVKAVHIQELRSNLDSALSAFGITPGSYTDSSLAGIDIKKIHLDELRQRVE